jgi:hypothetical protein
MAKLLKVISMLTVFWLGAAMAEAGEVRRALYDISLDMDGNGTPERAVLVLNNPFDDGLNHPARGIYMLAETERIDLYIYMNAGAAPVDISKPPQFRKENIVDRERFGWVGRLERNGQQSLKLYTSYAPGSTATFDETLIIAYRKGRFIVAGIEAYWEGGGRNGNCQYNFLTSTGFSAPGEFADNKTFIKAKVKPMDLSTWSPATRSTVCDDP